MYFHACKVEVVGGRERLSTGVWRAVQEDQRETTSDGFGNMNVSSVNGQKGKGYLKQR